MNIGLLLKQAGERIAGVPGMDPAGASIESHALLMHVLSVDRAWLIAHSKDIVETGEMAKFESMLERRLAGEPVPYILGRREFYGMDFKVNRDVLIPRPETELLVDLALERIPENGNFRVLDLGTGSGAIAVTIARQRNNALVIAAEKSSSALAVARDNGKGLENILFRESDWFESLAGERFDIILSNPPYIAVGDPHLKDLEFEPDLALASGKDGLDAIARIVEEAPLHLERGGWLLFEHGYDQGEACRGLLSGSFREVATWRDISGLERVSGGRLTSW